MASMKRRLEKRLETGLWLSTFMASALTDAGIYCARLVLTEEDHDESCPIDRHKRIPTTRAEIYKREGDGYEMCIAATSAIDEYMQRNDLTTGWFADAVRVAKKVARTVFHAGNDRRSEPQAGISYDEMHGITEQDKRNYARYLRGEAPPPLKDEERRYRTRGGGRKNFYVHDAIVEPQESSISAVEAVLQNPCTTSKRGENARKIAFKAVLRAQKQRGRRFADKVNQQLTELMREERFAEAIEYAYSI